MKVSEAIKILQGLNPNEELFIRSNAPYCSHQTVFGTLSVDVKGRPFFEADWVKTKDGTPYFPEKLAINKGEKV